MNTHKFNDLTKAAIEREDDLCFFKKKGRKVARAEEKIEKIYYFNPLVPDVH